MGRVYVPVKIGDPLRQRVKEVRMLVDTGATYPCIPEKLAVEAWYATAYMEILGRGDLVPLRVFDVEEPLLGVFALEALGIAVDLSTGEVKPTRGFIVRA